MGKRYHWIPNDTSNFKPVLKLWINMGIIQLSSIKYTLHDEAMCFFGKHGECCGMNKNMSPVDSLIWMLGPQLVVLLGEVKDIGLCCWRKYVNRVGFQSLKLCPTSSLFSLLYTSLKMLALSFLFLLPWSLLAVMLPIQNKLLFLCPLHVAFSQDILL